MIVASRPRNLKYVRTEHVEGDVFRICERLAEIDPTLYVNPIDPPVRVGDRTCNWAIVEQCADGVDRLVFRAEALDARIIEHVQFLLHVPFEQRFAEAERRADKIEADAHEDELDKLYERIGEPMLPLLERTGFIQRSRSYPKRGIHAAK